MGFTDFPNGVTSFGGIVLGAVGIGNVYYVCKTTDTAVYADMWKRYGGSRKKYEDDSLILHSTIQSALDATVECRNDYVIVMPSDSDYDLTAVLTMSKKSVHLICPAGLGYDVGATNAARIHQTTDAVKGETHYNTFRTCGDVDGGTVTHCLDIHGSGTAIGNRATVADSELVAGGTDELSFSDNMNSVAGGVIDDQDG